MEDSWSSVIENGPIRKRVREDGEENLSNSLVDVVSDGKVFDLKDRLLTPSQQQQNTIRMVFVVTIQNRPIQISNPNPIYCTGYQFQSITFKTLPTDTVGTIYSISSIDLLNSNTSSASIIQGPPDMYTDRSFVATINQAALGVQQKFPPISFNKVKKLNEIRFEIGNEYGEYSSSQFGTSTPCTIVIDFFTV